MCVVEQQSIAVDVRRTSCCCCCFCGSPLFPSPAPSRSGYVRHISFESPPPKKTNKKYIRPEQKKFEIRYNGLFLGEGGKNNNFDLSSVDLYVLLLLMELVFSIFMFFFLVKNQIITSITLFSFSLAAFLPRK